MNRFFTLVANNQLDTLFIARISKLIAQFGKFSIIHENTLKLLPKHTVLVVIDADDVTNAEALVKDLRQSQPGLTIVVFLLEHDLGTARAVFKMGANDCLVKGLDEEIFLQRLKNEYLKTSR